MTSLLHEFSYCTSGSFPSASPTAGTLPAAAIGNKINRIQALPIFNLLKVTKLTWLLCLPVCLPDPFPRS